jgi:phage terminase large subunit
VSTAVLEHNYVAVGAALELFKNKGREVILSGPAGTGKSRACLEKLNALALANPGMRGLIVRKTQVSMTSTALVTFREHVITEGLKAGLVEWYGGSRSEAACYRYTNGSVINVGGMDKPTKIMSSEYDVVYVQEAIELIPDDWEAILSRLRNGKISFQQVIADTNPDTETHWLKQRANSGKLAMLESRHRDNPVYWDASREEWTERGRAYMEILDSLTGVRLLRLRDGLWVAAEGVIFDQWDRRAHLLDKKDLPKKYINNAWRRIWTVDFGYTNPFVLQCWAIDGDGRMYLYREIYHTRRLVEDHAKQILSIVAPNGKWIEPKPEAIICDHDAEDRATLEKHLDMPTVPAHKSVSDGIQAVGSRMKPAGDGRPRIFVMRDALVERDESLAQAKKPLCTEEEIPGYVWNPEKDQPVKKDDHGCDAMRYAVAESDLGIQLGMRWVE